MLRSSWCALVRCQSAGRPRAATQLVGTTVSTPFTLHFQLLCVDLDDAKHHWLRKHRGPVLRAHTPLPLLTLHGDQLVRVVGPVGRRVRWEPVEAVRNLHVDADVRRAVVRESERLDLVHRVLCESHEVLDAAEERTLMLQFLTVLVVDQRTHQRSFTSLLCGHGCIGVAAVNVPPIVHHRVSDFDHQVVGSYVGDALDRTDGGTRQRGVKVEGAARASHKQWRQLLLLFHHRLTHEGAHVDGPDGAPIQDERDECRLVVSGLLVGPRSRVLLERDDWVRCRRQRGHIGRFGFAVGLKQLRHEQTLLGLQVEAFQHLQTLLARLVQTVAHACNLPRLCLGIVWLLGVEVRCEFDKVQRL
eukprot:2597271-Prymnesium_polylepis.2